MMNMVTLVGRLASDPQINEVNEKKVCYITIAVSRSYKNTEGIYETDFVNVVLWEGIAQSTVEYCHKGDLIAIKGRIESEKDKSIQIIAEKASFLSQAKAGEK